MAVLDIVIDAENNAKKALQEVSGQLDGLDASAKNANSRLGGVGNTLKTGVALGGRAAAGGALLAAGAMGTVAVQGTRMAADLEQQMSGIAAIMGETKESVAPLRDTIRELSLDPNLIVNTEQAAGAVEMLARNGLTMTEIIDGAARSTVLLANATDADFATAADIATDSMSVFNIAVEDMNQAVNGVTGVVNNSKFSIEDYRLALARGGAQANAAGVEFEDFNTAIAAIAPNFSSGQTAGTAMGAMLSRLAPNTESAKEAMDELGLITEQGTSAFFDAQGALRGMDEISGLLQGSLAGLSEAQRSQALQTIFGRDAMSAAIGLAETGPEKFNKLKDVIGNVDAEEAAATRMDNLKGVMEILQGIVESLATDVGSLLVPALTALVEQVSKFVEENGDAFVGIFESLVETLPKLKEPMTSFFMNLIGIVSKIKEFVEPAQNAVQAFTDLSEEGSGLSEMIGNIEDGIATLMETFAPDLEALSESFSEMVSEFSELGPEVEAFWEVAKPILTALGTTVGIVLVFALKLFASSLSSIMSNAAETVEVIITQITDTFETIADVWEDTVELVQALVDGDFDAAWESAKDIANTFKSFWLRTMRRIWQLVQIYFTQLKDTATQLLESLGVDAGAIMERFKSWWLRTFRRLWEIATNRFKAMKRSVQRTLNNLNTKAKEIINKIKAWWDTKWTALLNKVQPVVDAVNNIVTAFENVRTYLSTFSFPSINWPTPPAWITNPGSLVGGGGGQGQAAGTSFFRGGLATINERGPEALILPGRNRQMMLPQGTQIVSARETAAAMGGGGDIHVHMDGMVLSNDMDAESFAWRVANIIQRSQRGRR